MPRSNLGYCGGASRVRAALRKQPAAERARKNLSRGLCDAPLRLPSGRLPERLCGGTTDGRRRGAPSMRVGRARGRWHDLASFSKQREANERNAVYDARLVHLCPQDALPGLAARQFRGRQPRAESVCHQRERAHTQNAEPASEHRVFILAGAQLHVENWVYGAD